jgi:ribonucleoside-diphosphate reductase alpha chain
MYGPKLIRQWDACLSIGDKNGWRNAQISVLAPTGTIGLMMDCDTTGIEPDFSLVKFKKLVGGGSTADREPDSATSVCASLATPKRPSKRLLNLSQQMAMLLMLLDLKPEHYDSL